MLTLSPHPALMKLFSSAALHAPTAITKELVPLSPWGCQLIQKSVANLQANKQVPFSF